MWWKKSADIGRASAREERSTGGDPVHGSRSLLNDNASLESGLERHGNSREDIHVRRHPTNVRHDWGTILSRGLQGASARMGASRVLKIIRTLLERHPSNPLRDRRAPKSSRGGGARGIIAF
jgi:hypothetical protein